MAPKPLHVTHTPTGMTAEFSRDELEAFIHDAPATFHVEGVPVSAHTDLIREALMPSGDL